MAVLPDYVTGTITLAAGSTTVTGTGTMFETAAFRPGDTLQIQNLTAIIASVDGNTSLTLTEPWTGTSLTNAPYRARYLPDGARVTAQTTTLIELLGNGNLQALAGLAGAAKTLPYFTGAGSMDAVAGAANTMPYFTGVNGMAATGLTAFARTLLDDNDAATMLGTLGLTNDAIHSKSLDSFGNYWPSTAPIDVLSLPAGSSGLATASGHTNLPPTTPGVNFWYLEVQRTYSDNRRRIIATGVSGNAPSTVPVQYIISNDASGNWTPWRLLTVLEGSNSNGSYVRFPDGTQICYRAGVVTSSTWTATGAVFRSGRTDWTYPVSFIEAPLVLAGTNAENAWCAVANGNTTSGGVSFFLPFSYSQSLTARLAAIGRWF